MAIPVSGKTYIFTCVGAGTRVLNLYYPNSIANGQNVCLWSPDGSLEQQWLYSNYRLLSKRGTSYALDKYTVAGNANNNNADIWTANDEENQRINFVSLGGNTVKIKLYHSGLYLTAYSNANGTANGKTPTSAGNIYWAAEKNSNLQKWTFTEVPTGGTTTGPAPIAPPSNIESVNIMQRYNAPLSFTGSTITINNVENDTSTEYYHRGSGFRPSEAGMNFLDTANGETVLSTIRNFAKKVFGLSYLPSRKSCAYYLFGEYDSSAKFHHGVDMNIEDGHEIKPFWGGKVVAKGGSYGRVQIYVPEFNVTTIYMHMKDIPSSFNIGDTIDTNTVIGYQSNKSPYSITSHLHFEVRAGNTAYAGDNTASGSGVALTSIIPYGYMKK
jgi:hypothetical protein